jgi:hypothetical protein
MGTPRPASQLGGSLQKATREIRKLDKRAAKQTKKATRQQAKILSASSP